MNSVLDIRSRILRKSNQKVRCTDLTDQMNSASLLDGCESSDKSSTLDIDVLPSKKSDDSQLAQLTCECGNTFCQFMLNVPLAATEENHQVTEFSTEQRVN